LLSEGQGLAGRMSALQSQVEALRTEKAQAEAGFADAQARLQVWRAVGFTSASRVYDDKAWRHQGMGLERQIGQRERQQQEVHYRQLLQDLGETRASLTEAQVNMEVMPSCFTHTACLGFPRMLVSEVGCSGRAACLSV
jgi:hypothetical protein